MMLLLFPLRLVGTLLLYVLRPLSLGLFWLARAFLFAVTRIFLAAWHALARLLDVVFWPATRVIDRLGRAYPGMLRSAIHARRAVLPLAFAGFVMAVAVVPLLGTNLVPDLSQGEFAFRIRLDEGTTLEASAEIVERIERRAIEDGRFARVFSVVGNWPSTASGRRTAGENLARVRSSGVSRSRASRGEEMTAACGIAARCRWKLPIP